MRTDNPDRWSGRVGFIVATVGSAVGIGSIWKFPYEVGSNGGGALILRIIGDCAPWWPARRWGALLNAAAIVLFFATMVYGVLASRRDTESGAPERAGHLASHSRPEAS